MSAVTSQPVIPAQISELVRRHGVEADLHKLIESAQTCFAELRGLDIDLVEDPDTDGRTWVVLRVTLPCSHPKVLLRTQRKRYREEDVRLALARPPRLAAAIDFGLRLEFVQE